MAGKPSPGPGEYRSPSEFGQYVSEKFLLSGECTPSSPSPAKFWVMSVINYKNKLTTFVIEHILKLDIYNKYLCGLLIGKAMQYVVIISLKQLNKDK